MVYLEFNHISNEAFFNSNGYLIIDLPYQEILEPLEDVAKKAAGKISNKFFYSLLENEVSEILLDNKKIDEILDSTYRAIFKNYHVRSSSYLAKPAAHHEEMYLHRDWSFTDVFQYQTGTLWIPLQDVDIESGAMFVLKGSHLIDQNYISASLQTQRIPLQEIDSKDLEVLSIKRGQAIVFNPHIWHGSFPNFSNHHRIVFTAQVFPKNAPFNYYHQDEKGLVWEISLPDDDFILANLSKLAFNQYQFLGMQMRQIK